MSWFVERSFACTARVRISFEFVQATALNRAAEVAGWVSACLIGLELHPDCYAREQSAENCKDAGTMAEVRWMQQVRVLFSSARPAERHSFCLQSKSSGVGGRRRLSRPDLGRWIVWLVVSCWAGMLISGCGVTLSGGLVVSPGTLSFGSVTVGQSTVSSVKLTNTGTTAIHILQLSLAGQSFNLAGGATLPITIPGGGSTTVQVQFAPASAGAITGQLTVNTDATNQASATVQLSGTGMETFVAAPVAALSGVVCSSSSITGAGTDNCTVSLSAPAGGGGFSVNLSSSNTAVTVPALITVPANATSTTFAATINAVPSVQIATITASTNGVDVSTFLQLNAATSVLSASVTNLAFGDVALNTAAQRTIALTSTGTQPVTITAATLNGTGFSDVGPGFPVTLNPNQVILLTVTFDPTTAGPATGQLAITSGGGGATTISLSGTGTESAPSPPAVALSGLSCDSISIAGAGTVSCTVTLSGAAPVGGFDVAIKSNNPAVVTPGTVTVPGSAGSTGFTVTVAQVTTAQTAVLTAAANGVSESVALNLSPGGPVLNVNATGVAFGSLTLNTVATQSVVLTSAGTQPVTVNAITVTGLGFSLANLAVPLTLNPGQSATLNLSFDPVILGLASGQVTITSNAVNGTSMGLSLSGTGVSVVTYAVDLTWQAPASSSDPVVGYNVYRSGSGTALQLLNAVVNAATSFADATVQSGASYAYYVTSVDSSGIESVPSNTYSVTIP